MGENSLGLIKKKSILMLRLNVCEMKHTPGNNHCFRRIFSGKKRSGRAFETIERPGPCCDGKGIRRNNVERKQAKQRMGGADITLRFMCTYSHNSYIDRLLL